MYRQFNIQQFYVLPTQCIHDWFYNREGVYCAVRTGYRVRSELCLVVKWWLQLANPPILQQPADRQCVFCTFCLILPQSLLLFSFRQSMFVVTTLLTAAPSTDGCSFYWQPPYINAVLQELRLHLHVFLLSATTRKFDWFFHHIYA